MKMRQGLKLNSKSKNRIKIVSPNCARSGSNIPEAHFMSRPILIDAPGTNIMMHNINRCLQKFDLNLKLIERGTLDAIKPTTTCLPRLKSEDSIYPSSLTTNI